MRKLKERQMFINLKSPFTYDNEGEPVIDNEGNAVQDGVYQMDNGDKLTVLNGVLKNKDIIDKSPFTYNEIGEKITDNEGNVAQDGIYYMDNGDKLTVIEGVLKNKEKMKEIQ